MMRQIGEIQVIQSPLFDNFPEICHGFSSRIGDNRKLFCDSLGIQGKTLMTLKQVHGDKIVLLPSHPDVILSAKHEGSLLEGDGGLTSSNEIALAIQTADCLPLLFYDPEARLIAAVHAGWRGTALEIAKKGIRLMIKQGSQAENIYAALGPCIQACCFEVGTAVPEKMPVQYWREPFIRGRKKDHWLLNLPLVNSQQLLECGLCPDHIWASDLCTFCRSDLFYSYRREGESAGRHLSVIGFK